MSSGYRLCSAFSLGPENNALHQTRRGGAVASRPVVEARLAGERECSTGLAKVHHSSMRVLLVATMVWFAPSVGAGVASDRLTAAKVHTLIDAVGDRAAVQQLFDSGALENAVVDGIATGGAGWLRVAERLKPASDGAAGELLSIAVQEALPKNPAGVLALVRRGAFPAIHACGNYGFGQIEHERPLSVVLRLVDRRVRAVRSVLDPRLATEQRLCIEELGKLRIALERALPK